MGDLGRTSISYTFLSPITEGARTTTHSSHFILILLFVSTAVLPLQSSQHGQPNPSPNTESQRKLHPPRRIVCRLRRRGPVAGTRARGRRRVAIRRRRSSSRRRGGGSRRGRASGFELICGVAV